MEIIFSIKSKVFPVKCSIISFIFLVLLCVCYPVPPGFALENNGLSATPLNPEFAAYIQNQGLRHQQSIDITAHPTSGYIPPPIKLNNLNADIRLPSAVVFPTSYDLRNQQKLTPVKAQGSSGSCWTFATYASMESCLLPGEARDFSENNLKNSHGFDFGPNDGGNHLMSTAYLARWSGPVDEVDDPYNPNSTSSKQGLPIQKHVQDITFIADRSGPLDNDRIKQAVMDSGAVHTVMSWNDNYYNAAKYSYYDSLSAAYNINHGVAIVGWDDNFDKNSFKTPAPGNGAFIVRNSWGKSWGQGGYFYISYYDVNIGKENAVFNGIEAVSNYNGIYQYDPYGWTLAIGGGSYSCWGANVFTAAASDSLTAVSFYTGTPNASYEIYIYNNVNISSGPKAGILAGKTVGTIKNPGYHTVELDAPVALTAGKKFSVVLKLTTPGDYYPIATECTIPGYNSDAGMNPKESWASGNGVSWTDLYYSGYGNVCLKAFTSTVANEPLPAAINLSSPNGGETWTAGSTQTISWFSTGSPGNNVKIDLLKGGAFFSNITPQTPSASGYYNWTIPEDLPAAGDYAVIITSTSNSDCRDSSDGYFSIDRPTIALTSPNGGEIWASGSKQTIRWSYTGNPGPYVKLELLENDLPVRTIMNMAPVGTGYYSWTIPAGLTGNDYKVRITGVNLSSCTDMSDNSFSITGPAITVTSPNGGETWAAGSKQTINWSYTGNPGSYVKIELLQNDKPVKSITSQTSNSKGNYSWTLPSNLTGAGYKIRITSTTDSSCSDTSDKDFTIAGPTVTLDYPNGGDTWAAGSKETIRWSFTGNPGSYVKIELLQNDKPVKNITSRASNSKGNYSWTLPSNLTGAGYKIRITSTTDSSCSDTSDKDFTIAGPTVTLDYPNGGDTWTTGSKETIRWFYTGNPGSYVKLELLSDSQPFKVITSRTSCSKGYFNWTIPSNLPPEADYTVRVTGVSSDCTDTSDGAFTVVGPTITLKSPNGGESWAAGSKQTISWSYTGNPGSYVKLELLKSGVPVKNITSSTSNSRGYFIWTLPTTLPRGGEYEVRVTATNGSCTDTSDSYINII
ncbi:MAG: Ser-Thr-rich glycosyl-phosphatidyl-inositol-anchored membrane family protein [Pelotomaculum sp. PtaB.Bin104]|nr:MAG: Ser-Thr-rich glycosyl-phosphatidyl-inositol-anchored membrane family protein [Pelotomaculum sp. PtaB.Bin104]